MDNRVASQIVIKGLFWRGKGNCEHFFFTLVCYKCSAWNYDFLLQCNLASLQLCNFVSLQACKLASKQVRKTVSHYSWCGIVGYVSTLAMMQLPLNCCLPPKFVKLHPAVGPPALGEILEWKHLFGLIGPLVMVCWEPRGEKPGWIL